MRGAERGPRAVQAGAARNDFEKAGNLPGENTFALESLAPRADVEFAAAQLAQAAEHTVFFGGHMGLEPVEKNIFHRVRQAKDRVAGARGAGCSRGVEDGGYFVVGEAGDDGRDIYAHGHAGFGEEPDGAQAVLGPRGARLEFPGELGIKRGHSDRGRDALPARELGQEIAVACDEEVFRDEADRIAKLEKHLEALAHEAEMTLGGLVAVGDAAADDNLRLPPGRGEFVAQQPGGAELDEDFGLEIKAAVPAEVVMVGTRVTVGAAVFAAAIGVQAGRERNVGAVVVSENGFARIEEKLRAWMRLFLGWRVGVGLAMKAFETVGRVEQGAAMGKRRGRDWRSRRHDGTLTKKVEPPVSVVHGFFYERLLPGLVALHLTMVKIIRSVIAFGALASALRAADPGPTPEDTLKDLVARQQALFADAEKAQGSPDFDQENFKSQLQQLADAYSVLLRDQPKFTEARVDYGQMLWKIDMRKEAVVQLLEANALDKDIPVVKNLLGNYLAEDGRPVEALPYFMAAIQLAPRESLYHYNLGTLLFAARDDFLKDGHWTRAALDHSMLEAFRRAAELAPDRTEYTYRYAKAFYDLETPDWENALKSWRALELQAKPGLELQFLQLQEATVLLKQKKPDDARALLDAITEPKLAEQKQKLVAQLPPKPAK